MSSDTSKKIENENSKGENKKITVSCLKQYLRSIDKETKFKFWIKTLLSSNNIFPEITKSIDKIIELQASTISFSSNIFNGDNSLEQYVEKMIDLSERKAVLVNIYLMVRDLFDGLSDEQATLIEKRYIFNWSIDDLAATYNVSERTIYRKIEKIIDIIYKNAIGRNWSLGFIESQIKNEDWLKGRFLSLVKEYLKNINYHQYENDDPTPSNVS